MIDKVYELVCDNPSCGNAMNHLYGSLKQVIEQAKEYGHIIVGKKCYCDQNCHDTRNKPVIKARKLYKKNNFRRR